MPRPTKPSTLTTRRLARRFTIRELSDRCGLSPATLVTMDANLRSQNNHALSRCRVSTYQAVARALRCKPRDLWPVLGKL